MPKIICNNPGNLTGQVGSVEFVKSEAHVEEGHPLLEFFRKELDRFEVHEDPPAAEPTEAEKAEKAEKAAEAAEAEAKRLADEQAEADKISAEQEAAQAAEAERIAAEQKAAEDAAGNPPAPTTDPETDPYEDLTVEELRKAAKAAGVHVAGSKAELQERLREHDKNATSDPQE